MVEYIYLQGKAKWFKHQQPNKFGNWSHDVYLNEASLAKVKELQETKGKTDGIKNALKEDDDGQFISLSRPQSKTIRGKVVGFAPPEVLGKDGLPLHDMLVGNGSDITTKVEYYTYRKPYGDGRGSAIRWASTRVDNLVPFKTQRDFDPDQANLVGGLNDAPGQPEF
jgi:hypothetical protein